jgi:hypothetical protein
MLEAMVAVGERRPPGKYRSSGGSALTLDPSTTAVAFP